MQDVGSNYNQPTKSEGWNEVKHQLEWAAIVTNPPIGMVGPTTPTNHEI